MVDIIHPLVKNAVPCLAAIDDNLTFNYLIKKGVSPTRNAVRLLKYLGYPEEIIENTEKRIALEEAES